MVQPSAGGRWGTGRTGCGTGSDARASPWCLARCFLSAWSRPCPPARTRCAFAATHGPVDLDAVIVRPLVSRAGLRHRSEPNPIADLDRGPADRVCGVGLRLGRGPELRPHRPVGAAGPAQRIGPGLAGPRWLHRGLERQLMRDPHDGRRLTWSILPRSRGTIDRLSRTRAYGACMSQSPSAPGGDEVALTNLDQPLFDGAGATKRDLVSYMERMADRPDHAPPGPATVGHPSPSRPGSLHAEEPAEVHP